MPSRSRLRWLFALALAACSSSPPIAHAATVQFLPCDVVDGIDASASATNGTAGLVARVQSIDAKLLPSPAEPDAGAGSGNRLHLNVNLEPKTNPPCADQASQPWNVSLAVSTLGLSRSSSGRPENVSCFLRHYPPGVFVN